MIFKESFLHANEYFLSPGNPGMRSPSYLNTEDRIKAIIKASTIYGISVNNDYLKRFDDSDEPPLEQDKMLIGISDYVTNSLVDDLIKTAKDIVDRYNLDEYSRDGVDRVISAFSNGVPIYTAESLTNILNGAWEFYNHNYQPWDVKFPNIHGDRKRRENMLSEIVIKSIEILYILKRLE